MNGILIIDDHEIVRDGLKNILNEQTHSTYRARILEKMGMKTNAELTHYAIQNKLV